MKQQKMKTNKETGRSMVEMLGVLAVIGVLSIGGIAGYTMAMNRHRANELLDGASKRAIVAMQQISLGKSASEVSLGEFTSNVVAGGTFSGDVLDLGDGEIGIQASGIEKAVCENLVNMVSGDVEVVKVVAANEVTDMEASDCSDTASNNTLAVVFKDSGSGAGSGADDAEDTNPEGKSCTTNDDCAGWGGNWECDGGSCTCFYALCEDGLNQGYCVMAEAGDCPCSPACTAANSYCEDTVLGSCSCTYGGTYPDCITPECTTNDDCPDGKSCASGSCVCTYGGDPLGPYCCDFPFWTCCVEELGGVASGDIEGGQYCTIDGETYGPYYW